MSMHQAGTCLGEDLGLLGKRQRRTNRDRLDQPDRGPVQRVVGRDPLAKLLGQAAVRDFWAQCAPVRFKSTTPEVTSTIPSAIRHVRGSPRTVTAIPTTKTVPRPLQSA